VRLKSRNNALKPINTGFKRTNSMARQNYVHDAPQTRVMLRSQTMKITFLPSALDDLEWMKRYYQAVFPAGKPLAAKRYRSALAVLRNNPKAGAPSEVVDSLREHPIPNTSFSLIYQLTKTEIRIFHVKGQRSIKPIHRPE